MLNRCLFHQGGHENGGCCGHHHEHESGEGCCHEHEHSHNHGHSHEHSHDHEHASPELSPEQTIALMTYMLDHNRSHAQELHNIGHALEAQDKIEAAELVFESVHFFEHCNDKLEAALLQVKGV